MFYDLLFCLTSSFHKAYISNKILYETFSVPTVKMQLYCLKQIGLNPDLPSLIIPQRHLCKTLNFYRPQFKTLCDWLIRQPCHGPFLVLLHHPSFPWILSSVSIPCCKSQHLSHPHSPTLMLFARWNFVTYLLAGHLQETLCFQFTIDSSF